MLCKLLTFAAIALATPGLCLAEIITLVADPVVDVADALGGQPAVPDADAAPAEDYFGFQPATLPQPDLPVRSELTVGIRPRVWNRSSEPIYTRGAEPPAAVTVVRGKRPEAVIAARNAPTDRDGFDFGIDRTLAEVCQPDDPRYADALLTPRAD